MKTPAFISKYWPIVRDYTLFVIGCVLLISPFVTFFIYGLLYEITTFQLKNRTFFSLLLEWFLPAVKFGLLSLLLGISQLAGHKKDKLAPRLWMVIVIIAFLVCSALLASYGIEGYCGERLQQSCGEWH